MRGGVRLRAVAVAALAVFVTTEAAVFAEQQRRRTPARRQPARSAPAKPKPEPPPPPMPVVEAATMQCPQMLGEGVRTKRAFCDVLIGREPSAGIVITIPPHMGDVTLRFDLHNRHTYSEELAKTNRGFRQYTATVGLLTSDNYLVSRAIVMSEFRAAADLVDRVSGGSGPGGVKAVAPSGTEAIVITMTAEQLPPEVTSLSILGEKLTEARIDGVDTFTAIGRPVAVISNVLLEYTPAPPAPEPTPPAKPAPARPGTAKPAAPTRR